MRRRPNSHSHALRFCRAFTIGLFFSLIAIQKSLPAMLDAPSWREVLAQLSCEDFQRLNDGSWSVRGQFEIEGRTWTNPIIEGRHLLDLIGKCGAGGGSAFDGASRSAAASPITPTWPVFGHANGHSDLSAP